MKCGDTYWRGFGLKNGRDVDDATTDPCETEEEAIKTITEDWFSWLSKRERSSADVYARQFRCTSVYDDGQIGVEITI